MASAKDVMAEIFTRFVDKPGHNMLAHEVAKKLDAAGYVIVPKEPTEEMYEAAGHAFLDAAIEHEPGNLKATNRPFRRWWDAMLRGRDQ